MKKIFLSGIIFIIIGFYIGNYIFSNKKNIFEDNCYFILEGVYANKSNIDGINTNKLIDYIDNKYYVYLGITKNLETAKRIQSIYKKQGIETFIDQRNISSTKLLKNIEEFDLLIKNSNDKEILLIEDLVLATYKKNSSKT